MTVETPQLTREQLFGHQLTAEDIGQLGYLATLTQKPGGVRLVPQLLEGCVSAPGSQGLLADASAAKPREARTLAEEIVVTGMAMHRSHLWWRLPSNNALDTALSRQHTEIPVERNLYLDTPAMIIQPNAYARARSDWLYHPYDRDLFQRWAARKAGGIAIYLGRQATPEPANQPSEIAA